MPVTEARTRRASRSPAPAPARAPAARCGGPLTPWLFLAPALLLFLYFKFIPMAQAVQMSFQEVRPYLGDTLGRGRELPHDARRRAPS